MDKRKRSYLYVYPIGIGRKILKKKFQKLEFEGCTPIKVRWKQQQGYHLREGAFVSFDSNSKFANKIINIFLNSKNFGRAYIWDDDMEEFYSQKWNIKREEKDKELYLLDSHLLRSHFNFKQTPCVITKEMFIEIMTELVDRRNKLFEWVEKLDEVFPNAFESVFEHDFLEPYVKTLGKIMNDKENWLDCFIFENNCKPFTYRIGSGDYTEEIMINTFEELFDLIVSNN